MDAGGLAFARDRASKGNPIDIGAIEEIRKRVEHYENWKGFRNQPWRSRIVRLAAAGTGAAG